MKQTRATIGECISIFILVAVSGMLALSPTTLTKGAQDPVVPSSPPYVSLSPDSIDFGNQVVGKTSRARRVTLQNTGGKQLYIDSVVLGGDNPTSFALLRDKCTGATVDPNKACIVDVTFTPSRNAQRNAQLTLTDNALDSPQIVTLKGVGINSNDVAPF